MKKPSVPPISTTGGEKKTGVEDLLIASFFMSNPNKMGGTAAPIRVAIFTFLLSPRSVTQSGRPAKMLLPNVMADKGNADTISITGNKTTMYDKMTAQSGLAVRRRE